MILLEMLLLGDVGREWIGFTFARSTRNLESMHLARALPRHTLTRMQNNLLTVYIQNSVLDIEPILIGHFARIVARIVAATHTGHGQHGLVIFSDNFIITCPIHWQLLSIFEPLETVWSGYEWYEGITLNLVPTFWCFKVAISANLGRWAASAVEASANASWLNKQIKSKLAGRWWLSDILIKSGTELECFQNITTQALSGQVNSSEWFTS